MLTPNKTVLVMGATGKQGGALIENILASPKPALSALWPSHVMAPLQGSGACRSPQRVSNQGDMSNPEEIFSLAGPVWAVYSVHVNSDTEEQQGKAVVDAAALNGAQHSVYSYGDRGGPKRSPDNRTSVKNFAAKYEIEKHLEYRAANSPQKMSYTILRPVTFFDNLSGDIHGKAFRRMWEQLGDKKLQFVSTKDIGWFAAQSMIHLDEYRNVALTLAGDELTQPEAAVIFKDVVGKPMPLAPCPIASAVKFALKGTVGDMFKWFAEGGYGGDVRACRTMNPMMQDFRAWVGENKGRWA